MLKTEKKRNPGLWVSVLYFAEGLPYTVVNTMSIVFLKGLGASNELIGLTSFLSLPWVLKGFWGPIVDIFSTRRQWILRMELVCIVLFLSLAIASLLPNPITISIIVFAIIAFFSATHDIAIDGFYLTALNPDQQALFVGVRNTAYRMAVLAGGGGLVFIAGDIAERYLGGKTPETPGVSQGIDLSILGSSLTVQPLQLGWAIAWALSAVIFAAIYAFQRFYLPYPQIEKQPEEKPKTLESSDFLQAFITYFNQYKIGWILAYIMLFRLGDALTFKMAIPFLMDQPTAGGMGITTAEIARLSGTVGVIFLLIGGLLGGFIIAKQGLKRWMWPMAILQNSTNVLYWLLAMNQPGLVWAYVVNSVEQFTYGLGIAAYTVFLMRTVRPEYKASHYAITTGFMAAGVLIPGVYSGYLQSWLGYESYFLMSAFAVIPGMITIFFLPLDDTSQIKPMPRPGLDDEDLEEKTW